MLTSRCRGFIWWKGHRRGAEFQPDRFAAPPDRLGSLWMRKSTRSIFRFLPDTPEPGRVWRRGYRAQRTQGPRGSYVRLLSLLAYELLGGPRARLDATGQYTPVATLDARRKRRVAAWRWSMNSRLQANCLAQLAATVGTTPSLSLRPESEDRVALEDNPRPPAAEGP